MPRDEHDALLLSRVHPEDWQNPQPRSLYDLVVIGAGSGGLVTAAIASTLGARVALIERRLLGGDCLNVGCVPSKSVIRAGRLVAESRAAGPLFVEQPGFEAPDFPKAMERMRRIRSQISEDDSARRYADELGVDVFLGDARFTKPGEIEVDETTLPYARAVIATGARPVAPPIPGLEDVGHLDNESVFDLTQRPDRLALIGAGPLGCELAQAFQRLGCQVTIYEQADQLLTREDPDAAALVQQALVRDGVQMVFQSDIEQVEKRDGRKVIRARSGGSEPREETFDEILVGAGRAPNVQDLGLDRVSVSHDEKKGVLVDDHLQTSSRRIWAVGDCCMPWKFTHAAEAGARLVVQNALFSFGPFGKKRVSDLIMPWCTYTQPELAHVGAYQDDREGSGIATFRVPLSEVDRAVTDGQEEGLVKIHVKKGSDRILGATIVADHAGELISQVTLAMKHGVGLGAFSDLI
ncbi:MAG: mercuric reductase, partial [bacterium]